MSLFPYLPWGSRDRRLSADSCARLVLYIYARGDSLCASGFIGGLGLQEIPIRVPSLPRSKKEAYFRALTSPDRKELPCGASFSLLSLSLIPSRRALASHIRYHTHFLSPCIIKVCIFLDWDPDFLCSMSCLQPERDAPSKISFIATIWTLWLEYDIYLIDWKMYWKAIDTFRWFMYLMQMRH